MIEPSLFSFGQPVFDSVEQMEQTGTTCDTFRVKLYGKLLFLKQLKPKYAGDIRYQEAFRKEFETGYRLEHPALVRYLSLNDDAILMEFVDGDTLSQQIERHPDFFRSRRNTDRLLYQLLDAVAYLHAHQVLHLDLKPDNILLTRINNDVRLVDLGCCYTDTFVDTKGHTNGFAAPEQLNGDAVDARTDIYAIGRIMQRLPNAHIYKKVARRCTEADPAHRYQSIDEVVKALKGIQQRRWILLPVVLLVFAAVIMFYVWSTRQKQPSGIPAESLDSHEVTTTSDTFSSTDTFSFKQNPSFSAEMSTPSVNSPSTYVAHPATSPSSPTTSLPSASSASSLPSTPSQGTSAAPSVPSSSLSIPSPNASPKSLPQLREEIRRRILPKYTETLGALPDTVKRGDKAWTDANRLFQSKVEEEFKALFINYCQLVPINTISKEFNDYLNSLYERK